MAKTKTQLTPQEQEAKLAKDIHKLVGLDKKYLIMIHNETDGSLQEISNFSNRIELIGMLEVTKQHYIESVKNNG